MQIDNSRILAATLQEIKQPRLAATEQFFSVHELAENNPLEFVKRIPSESPDKPEHWSVFLSLKHVSYFCLLSFEYHEEELVPVSCLASELAKLYLVIWSDKLTGYEIEELLDLQATEIRIKGQPISTKSLMIAKEHRYYYYPNIPKSCSFEEKLDQLLKDLEGKEGILRKIESESSLCQVNVAYYSWQESMWGCHFNTRALSSLSKLGLELDLDIYAEGLPLIDDI